MKVPLGIVVKVFLCLYQHNPHALFFFFVKILEFTMQHLLILNLCKVKGFCRALFTEVDCN